VGSPEALKAALISDTRVSGWCTFAVFVGLVVEYAVLLWLKRKEVSAKEISVTVIAGLLIAGGVFGEYVFGSRAADSALALQGYADREVASLNKDAAEARLEQEQLRAANLALELSMKRREISDRLSASNEAGVKLMKELSGFPKTPLFIQCVPEFLRNSTSPTRLSC
jgi:hypothetical protein